jgi:hypothetical protein
MSSSNTSLPSESVESGMNQEDATAASTNSNSSNKDSNNEEDDKYSIKKEDPDGFCIDTRSIAPIRRTKQQDRYESLITEEEEADPEAQSYGIFPSKTPSKVKHRYSDDDNAAVPGEDMSNATSIKSFKKISPLWVFKSDPNAPTPIPRVRTMKDDPPRTTMGTSSGSTKKSSHGGNKTPIKYYAAPTTTRVATKKPAPVAKGGNGITSTKLDLSVELQPPSAVVVDDGLDTASTFDTYPMDLPVDQQDPRHSTAAARISPPGLGRGANSLSFASYNGISLVNSESFSDVQSWISLDRVIKASPSFPPNSGPQVRNKNGSLYTIPLEAVQESGSSLPLSVSPDHNLPHSRWMLPERLRRSLAGKKQPTPAGSATGSGVSPPTVPPRGFPPSATNSGSAGATGTDIFIDEQETQQQKQKRLRKWDMMVAASFIIMAIVLGATVAYKLLTEKEQSNEEEEVWVRVTPPPNHPEPIFIDEEMSNNEPWIPVVPTTTELDDSNGTWTEEIEIDLYPQGPIEAEEEEEEEEEPIDYAIPLPDYTRHAIEQDPNSPQAKAYRWLVNDPNWETYPEWRLLQRFALVTLYYATNGHEWTLSNSWLVYEISECNWYSNARWENSILCDEENHYWSLMLGHNGLHGTLPPELGLMDSIQQLDLRSNDLKGPLPFTLGLLSNLKRIDAAENVLTGHIPSEIGILSDLAIVDISSNNLTNTIPSTLGQLSNIQELYLGTNTLEGPLPVDLASASALEMLSLGSNLLNGTIPSAFATLTNLKDLDLGSNQVS